ncbi:MAG: zinc ABC transporter substrate-binding protein [Oscillospiraceae bacterium]|nr:zinc ABC transporter substrate-binding protein [Oscillospiraceae bacterium]
MKSMKIQKICAAAAAVLLCGMMLSGCGAQKNDTLTVVTTVYTTYDFAKQLTASYEKPVEVRLLLTPGGESHSYEPTPSDVAAIQSCDLFVYIGGASETWAEKLIETSRQKKENLRMFDCVDLLGEETVEGMEPEDEHEAEHEEDEIDEHIWTAPLNADKMLTAMQERLNKIAPKEQEHCDAAYEKLHGALLALDQRAREIHDNAKQDTLIFADRFPFRYLTDAYGWKYYAAFSGCTSDTDASPATLSFLISKVKSENIKTVFYLENSSQKIADAVCAATGAHAEMLQSCNNVTRMDYDAGMHYQQLMTENLDAIEEALK